jgi:predicted RecB family nuclease
VLLSDGGLEHREYLCAEDKDPREEFTATLLDALGTRGSIFIYTSYETTILNELVGHLPQCAEPLLAIIDRFKDLHAILRRHYYHPGFMGSFSLKAVLPALIPEMDYKNLNIQEGTEASLEYLRMIDPSSPEEEKEIIRRSLLEYCAHDTLAMVKIREKLLKRF